MKKFFLYPFIALVMLAFVGCNNPFREALVNDFITQLNNWTPGLNDFHVVKMSGASFYDRKFAVVQSDTDGKFYAVNLEGYRCGMDMNEFVNNLILDFTFNIQEVTQIGTSNIYESTSSNMVFEETQASSKDLELVAYLNEQYNLREKSDRLVAEFGLSEDRALNVAKVLNEWGKIKNKRSITNKDLNNISSKLFGSSFDKMYNAYKSKSDGNPVEWEDFIDKAAKVNQISPERFNKIVETLVQ